MRASNNRANNFKFEGGTGFDEYFQVGNRYGKDTNSFGKIETPSVTTRIV